MKPYIGILLLGLISCGSIPSTQNELNIACSANMEFAMDSIVVLFETEHGIDCNITTGSSGMLTSQIENGAPYDIFLSADMTYPKAIYGNDKGEKPFIYARGSLLFAYRKELNYNSLNKILKSEEVKRIGIADEHTAPYGVAANQFLIETSQLDQIKNRLVIGESVGQVNQYLMTGAVDGGFTSYAFKVKNGEKFNYFEVEPELFKPINQGIMALYNKNKMVSEKAKKFVNFFSTEKCKAVLNYFGYLTD